MCLSHPCTCIVIKEKKKICHCSATSMVPPGSQILQLHLSLDWASMVCRNSPTIQFPPSPSGRFHLPANFSLASNHQGKMSYSKEILQVTFLVNHALCTIVCYTRHLVITYLKWSRDVKLKMCHSLKWIAVPPITQNHCATSV